MKIRVFIIFLYIYNLYGVDAVLNISKNSKRDSFYEIQLISLTSLDDVKRFYLKLPEEIQTYSNIYKFSKYYALRYGDASENKKALLNDLTKIKKLIKDAYILKINSQTLKKRVNFKSNKIIQTQKEVYEIKDNYEYGRVMAEADNLKDSNSLIKSIEHYESLFKFNPKNSLISSNLFYLYGKTKNWQRASESLENLDDKESLLYAYGVGAIESNDKDLEKNLKPYLDRDYSGYLNLILGVSKEKQNFTYQAYEYYKNAYLQNSYDAYLIYAYARACELVELYELAKSLYKQLSQRVEIEKSIQENAYLRYVELNNFGY